jgi:hypothetical protein
MLNDKKALLAEIDYLKKENYKFKGKSHRTFRIFPGYF